MLECAKNMISLKMRRNIDKPRIVIYLQTDDSDKCPRA